MSDLILTNQILKDAVEENIKLMPKEIAEAFALDVKSTVELIAKSNFK